MSIILSRIVPLIIRYKRFITYCFIGLVGASSDVALFHTLNSTLEVNYAIANLISVTLGITVTFILNSYLNFKVISKIKKRFVVYYSVGIIGLTFQWFNLFIFSDVFNHPETIVKICLVPVVAVIQYSLHSVLTFSNRVVSAESPSNNNQETISN